MDARHGEDENFLTDHGRSRGVDILHEIRNDVAPEINARRERVYELLTYSILLFSPTGPEIRMNRWRSKTSVGTINGTVPAYDFSTPSPSDRERGTIKTFAANASTLRYTWWSIVPRGALYFTYVRLCRIYPRAYIFGNLLRYSTESSFDPFLCHFVVPYLNLETCLSDGVLQCALSKFPVTSTL